MSTVKSALVTGMTSDMHVFLQAFMLLTLFGAFWVRNTHKNKYILDLHLFFTQHILFLS